MKAVAINEGPRKGGNTEILLRAVLGPLVQEGWETDLIQVGGKKDRGCAARERCFEIKNGRFAIENDVFIGFMGKVDWFHVAIDRVA